MLNSSVKATDTLNKSFWLVGCNETDIPARKEKSDKYKTSCIFIGVSLETAIVNLQLKRNRLSLITMAISAFPSHSLIPFNFISSAMHYKKWGGEGKMAEE